MIFIILCGGSGTRLFPISRKEKPKQIHRLISNNTLIQDTILRVKDINNHNNKESNFYYFITNNSIKDILIDNLNELNLNKDNYKIIIEPFGRNSSPAILMGTLLSEELKRKNEFIVVMSCDHKWDDVKFRELIQIDNLKKYEDQIITIGIKPSFPHTGYGYIKKEIGSELNKISQFKEKPDKETATRYVESGEYLWNSGTFIFKYDTLLLAYQKYANESLINGFQNINSIKKENNIIYLSPSEFGTFNDVAFDIEIMEKIDNGSVLSFDGLWSDIGSFDAIYDIKEKDENMNVLDGENIINYDTKNSYILNQQKDKKIICTIGLDNIVIVETEDVLLVMNKDNCQDIKKIISKIEKDNELKNVLIK